MSILPAALTVFLAATSGESVRATKQVTGATLDITVAQPVDDRKAAEIIEWIESTAESIASVYGRFPYPSPNVIVSPSRQGFWGGDDDAVVFGKVTRGNGGTIELFINSDRPIEEFYSDWTATHEFSHLMLPLLQRRHRWISEGFATYYQNVLMSRTGQYTPKRAWTKLTQGFARGRASRPELSPNDATSGGWRQATMKVYWSGASLALMADIELRRRSDGKESLDTVLDQLQSCCLPAHRKWSGTELFKKLDSFIDEPVFMPLYRRYADATGFPDPKPALNDLGVVITAGGNVRFRADAKYASIRDALTKQQSVSASPVSSSQVSSK